VKDMALTSCVLVTIFIVFSILLAPSHRASTFSYFHHAVFQRRHPAIPASTLLAEDLHSPVLPQSSVSARAVLVENPHFLMMSLSSILPLAVLAEECVSVISVPSSASPPVFAESPHYLILSSSSVSPPAILA
jgi:hypothetical protein